jgi:hypothetical protein
MGTQTSTTIKVNLQPAMIKNADAEAKRIGLSLQDFIRMLLGSYFSRSAGGYIAQEDRNILENARQEIREGKYTTIKTSKELGKYLDSLSE